MFSCLVASCVFSYFFLAINLTLQAIPPTFSLTHENSNVYCQSGDLTINIGKINEINSISSVPKIFKLMELLLQK